jgi:RimJ/RimL family protein N-acetyltransferase
MLKGEYVGLRAIERTDLKQLLDWRNNPDFRRFFREYRELSLANQNQWYDSLVLNDPQTMMFAIEDLQSSQLIGASGFVHINWINRNADLSIYIGLDDSYIDDRFAPDAAQVMIKYGFDELGLHRIWAEIYDFDLKKKSLFENLGFRLDGRHRETYWSNGRWHDSLFYSLLLSDNKADNIQNVNIEAVGKLK